MSNVVDLPTQFKERRDRHHALRLKINQRARELAELDQERYFLAMLYEIYCGKIDAELLPYWQPLKGEVIAPTPWKA